LRKNCIVLSVIALGAGMLAHAQTGAPAPAAAPLQTKIGIIHISNAIISTKDGQKAAAALTAKFAPKKADLEKKQSLISQLQDQLRKGSNTMSEEAKEKLMREIDQNTKAFNRETEDDQAELDQENNRIMQELGQKVMEVLIKYAKDNGYTIILDVSSQQTPVLWAANGTDVTQEIVALYDKYAASSAEAPPGTKPATPPVKPAGPSKP